MAGGGTSAAADGDEARHRLTELLVQLRHSEPGGPRSYRAIAADVHFNRTSVGEWLRGTKTPNPEQAATLATKLGGSEHQVRRARQLAAEGSWSRQEPRRAVAADEAAARAVVVPTYSPQAFPWRAAGVHAAAPVAEAATLDASSAANDQLPPYVLRDHDALLRDQLRQAASEGGFVVLVGDSSSGKTRSAYEALGAVNDLGGCQVAVPATGRDLVDLGRTGLLTQPTVIWLDKLRSFLDHAEFDRSLLEQLLRRGAVVLGALWNEDYRRYTDHPGGPDRPDPYCRQREVLDRARTPIVVAERFSGLERARAERETDDPRLVAALAADDGVTQTLAAGPALRHWWEAEQHSPAGVLVTAAADALRLGHRSALQPAMLAALAEAEWRSSRSRPLPPDWFAVAFERARTPVHRGPSPAPLSPRAGRDATDIAGYDVADYLEQLIGRRRRENPISDVVWNALLQTVEPEDLHRLAESASARGRLNIASRLLERGPAAEDPSCRLLLARLRANTDPYGRTRAEEIEGHWRRAVDAGNLDAYNPLSAILLSQNRWAELEALWRRAVEARHPWAYEKLAEVLSKSGNGDHKLIELWRRGLEQGERSAPAELARVVGFEPDVGRVPQDPAVLASLEADLRRATGDGHPVARGALVRLLDELGKSESALQTLRNGRDAGEDAAALELARRLMSADPTQEEVAEVEEMRRRANASGNHAVADEINLLMGDNTVEVLNELMVRCGDLARVDVDEVEELAGILEGLGSLSLAEAVWRRAAEAEVPGAVEGLIRLYHLHDDVDGVLEVVEHPSSDNDLPRFAVAEALIANGRGEEALALWADPDQPDSPEALIERGLVHEVCDQLDDATEAYLAAVAAGNAEAVGRYLCVLLRSCIDPEKPIGRQLAVIVGGRSVVERDELVDPLVEAVDVAADAGHFWALRYHAELLDARGRAAEAIASWERADRHDLPLALRHRDTLRQRLGLISGEERLRLAAVRGEMNAFPFLLQGLPPPQRERAQRDGLDALGRVVRG